MSDKKYLYLLICGHDDSDLYGDVFGRLVFELGNIPEKYMELIKKEAINNNKDPYNVYTEHQRGINEIRGIGQIYGVCQEFFTENYNYIIRKFRNINFIKDVITNLNKLEVCLLLVPANKFTTDIQLYMYQLIEYVNFMDIKHIIICINNMEADNVNYSKLIYYDIKSKLVDMLSSIGLSSDTMISFIPISGINGDNITKESDKMQWCNTTLQKILNEIVIEPNNLINKPIRLPLTGIYKIRGIGDVITGYLEQGLLNMDQDVKFLPTHTDNKPCIGKLKKLEMRHKTVDQIIPGNNVGIQVMNISKDNKPQKNDIMVLSNDQLKPCNKFTCKTRILKLPNSFGTGSIFIGYIGNNNCEIKLVEIIDKSTNFMNLIFQPLNPFVVEKYNDCAILGRIAIFSDNITCCMLGKIIDVE